MKGTVERVHVAPDSGAPVEAVEAVTAVAGRGLRGDRYFAERGTFQQRDGEDLTLIEAEAVEAVEADYDVSLAPGEHRRNVTTRGLALNHLVDRRFEIGETVCVGVQLCEPCDYLERTLEKRGVRNALVHRGGLRADVVETGTITRGDAVVPLAD